MFEQISDGIGSLRTFEKIGPHKYRIDMVDGETKSIDMVWRKTNAIIKIIVGFSTEVKDSLMALMNGDQADAVKILISSISKDLINNFFDEANEIANIALDEYDSHGKVVRHGDVQLLYPEEVKAVLDVVVFDLVGVLKNVLRPSALGKKQE